MLLKISVLFNNHLILIILSILLLLIALVVFLKIIKQYIREKTINIFLISLILISLFIGISLPIYSFSESNMYKACIRKNRKPKLEYYYNFLKKYPNFNKKESSY